MKLRGAVVAVTGAGGFIGSALVSALISAGARVRALTGPDDVPTPPSPSLALSMRGQITDAGTVLGLCKGAENVIHLAGPPYVSASFDQPMDYARIHILGTLQVLQACQIYRVRRLVYLSSAEVYGQPDLNPVTEDCPLIARSPYGACKIAAEQFIRVHAMTHGLQATVLRPFSIYGPGNSPYSIIGTLFRQIRGAESLSLHDLRPVRDYCYLDDLVRAITDACECSREGMLTLNVGSGQGVSVKELVTTFLNVLGHKIPVVESRVDRRAEKNEILKLVADICRSREVLGWTPRVSLDDGLRRMALTQNLLNLSEITK